MRNSVFTLHGQWSIFSSRPAHRVYFALAVFLCVSACAYQETKAPIAFEATRPRSILIIPPLNNTVEVNAPYVLYTALSRPLAERGFYVFPVAVIDAFFKDNGLPTPFEMNQISLDEIRQHIGADAVLYTEIKEWGRKYQLISSNFVVKADMKLVDTRTGAELWQQRLYAKDDNSSRSNQGGLSGLLIGAIVDQVVGSLFDSSYGLVRQASETAIRRDRNAIFKGPYRYTERAR